MSLVMPPSPTDDELKEWSGEGEVMNEIKGNEKELTKTIFSIIGKEVAALFGYDKRIKELEEKNELLREVAGTQFRPRITKLEDLCRDMYKRCLRGCGGCQDYNKKMGTCDIEIQQRIEALGLIEGRE